MPVQRSEAADALARLADFGAVIDVRSPAEFAEDHLPGALNWPVLGDDERRLVGTLYAQVSAFEARKVGAALVARNIARHLQRHAAAFTRDWQPLVYCWRGGDRSASMAWFLSQIGFRTTQLAGGYKAFRKVVLAQLDALPLHLRLRVLCGRTGSGKTRLLDALGRAGAQVLDLEALACHRGSVLGGLPGRPQPSQKAFDTAVWSALSGLDASRPVFVESESMRIGRLRVPPALIERMRAAGCVRIEMPFDARVALLLEDYAFFRADAEGFCRLLEPLVELRGRETVRGWQQCARAGRFAEAFAALLHGHYDPLYDRSTQAHFAALRDAQPLELLDGAPQTLDAAARRLIEAR